MHQREILNMEKEFNNNLEKMREHLKYDIQDSFKREIRGLTNENKDLLEEIDELKEIKGQLKMEIDQRDKRIEDGFKKIQILEESNQ